MTRFYRLVLLALAVVVVLLGADALQQHRLIEALRNDLAVLTARSDAATSTAERVSRLATQAGIDAAKANATATEAHRVASAAQDTAAEALSAARESHIAPAASAGAPPADTDAELAARGRSLALYICAACHIVAADQPRTPTLKPPAPDFRTIAARPTITRASVEEFLARPHGQMPDPMLIGEQREALTAYLVSLKPR